MKIAVDFAPGLHGHFLELVINRYIYNIPYTGKVFQSTGAIHSINVNLEYQGAKIAERCHYSSQDIQFYPQTEKVIFIQHLEKLDIVLLTNIYYRCNPSSFAVEDVDTSEVTDYQNRLMNVTDSDSFLMRANWFAKLNERLFIEPTLKRPLTDLPVYNFNFESFFNLVDFCNELKSTARFLNETFKFDSSLADLWHEFIKCNQGWKLYCDANLIIEAMLSCKEVVIPNDWKLQSYINFRLSRIFDLHDGQLYEDVPYPATTSELMSIVTDHIDNFDSRW